MNVAPVNGTKVSWLERVGAWPLSRRVLVLLLSAVVLFVATLPVANFASGVQGIAALGVAAAACLVGMLSALLIGELLPGPELSLYSLGIGMLLRMGIPLGTCVGVHAAGGWLAEAGTAYFFLVFYPVLLAIETGLTLSRNAYLQRVAQADAEEEPLLPRGGNG